MAEAHTAVPTARLQAAKLAPGTPLHREVATLAPLVAITRAEQPEDIRLGGSPAWEAPMLAVVEGAPAGKQTVSR